MTGDDAWSLEADMGWLGASRPSESRPFIDDGLCQRTKTSYCPRTLQPFLNRCTNEYGHKAGCHYVTTAAIAAKALSQATLPGFLPAIDARLGKR